MTLWSHLIVQHQKGAGVTNRDGTGRPISRDEYSLSTWIIHRIVQQLTIRQYYGKGSLITQHLIVVENGRHEHRHPIRFLKHCLKHFGLQTSAALYVPSLSYAEPTSGKTSTPTVPTMGYDDPGHQKERIIDQDGHSKVYLVKRLRDSQRCVPKTSIDGKGTTKEWYLVPEARGPKHCSTRYSDDFDAIFMKCLRLDRNRPWDSLELLGALILGIEALGY